MPHDFKKQPELTDEQMQFYYFESPHRQIFDDFNAKVVEVIDGDTINVDWHERDFTFPVRFLGIQAPELKDVGGKQAKEFLKQLIEGKEAQILIDKKNRVGKYGRLLGRVVAAGMEINEEMIRSGHAVPFDRRNDLIIPSFNSMLGVHAPK